MEPSHVQFPSLSYAGDKEKTVPICELARRVDATILNPVALVIREQQRIETFFSFVIAFNVVSGLEHGC